MRRRRFPGFTRVEAVIVEAARRFQTDISTFSNLVIRVPLRRYQTEPLRAVLTSMFAREGLEFLLIFPRQSGKNEAVAQLLVYLLNIYRRVGGNIIYGAQSIGQDLGIGRLEERLDNPWNAGKWNGRSRKPQTRSLGRASIVFLSTHPTAHTRGQTAHHLLVIDEAQDQDAATLNPSLPPCAPPTTPPPYTSAPSS